eukprot:COSAG03_NODE_2101_length_3123_cov_69.440807_4_plen_91_part_00
MSGKVGRRIEQSGHSTLAEAMAEVRSHSEFSLCGFLTARFLGIHGEMMYDVTRMPSRRKSNPLVQPSHVGTTWQGDSSFGTFSCGGTTWS